MLYDPKWETKTDSQTKSTLIAARKLIENKDDWFGVADNPVCSNLCAFQAVSAVATDRATGDAARAALDAAVGCSMFSFNDEHTHAEVLAAFDRAIAVA